MIEREGDRRGEGGNVPRLQTQVERRARSVGEEEGKSVMGVMGQM